jgi:hypothetical protein
MASELTVRKIYIDSRFKTSDSRSDSDFKYELVQSVQMPENTKCFIDDVIIPVAWYNIDKTNNKLYCRLYNEGTALIQDSIIQLTSSNHTIESFYNELVSGLTTAFGSSTVTVEYIPRQLKFVFVVSGGNTFKIWTDYELNNPTAQLAWTGDPINGDLNSVNKIINNYTSQLSEIVYSGIVDLRKHHNLYITSNITSFQTLGPRGESGIVKKVPVNNDFGFTLYNEVVAPYDHIDVSKLLLKTLEFKIVDAYGQTVDLRGLSVSFSLIFMNE